MKQTRSLSLIRTNVCITVYCAVYCDCSGGFFSYIDDPDKPVDLAEITEDEHERIVMNKEYEKALKKLHRRVKQWVCIRH